MKELRRSSYNNFNSYISATALTGTGGAGVGETITLDDDESSDEVDVDDWSGLIFLIGGRGRWESSEEDDVVDEVVVGRFGFGSGPGESSEEDDVDEDVAGRFGSGGRGKSSEEDDELDADAAGRFGSGGRGVSSEGKEDEEPIGRNAHSAIPLSLGARGQ